MTVHPLLVSALVLTGAVALWGILDTAGLAAFASSLVTVLFTSRGWFIMLTVSVQTLVCLWLALSPYGRVKLGRDEDEPYARFCRAGICFGRHAGFDRRYAGGPDVSGRKLVVRVRF